MGDRRAHGIDLVCGGFPCQDLSAAGKRSGFKGDRSSLFYELARVVAELEPRYVLLENVRGLLTAVGSRSNERGSAMAEVTGTLADLGFTRIDWVMLGASDVGAPHRRHRIFILATHPDDQRLEGLSGDVSGVCEPGRVTPGSHRPAATPRLLHAPDPEGERLQRSGEPRDGRPRSTDGDSDFRWGAYEPAIRRWEAVMGPAPRPVDEKNRLSPEFVGWMMAFPPGWNEGESRTNRLKQFGNAVVWLQAYRALQMLAARASREEAV